MQPPRPPPSPPSQPSSLQSAERWIRSSAHQATGQLHWITHLPSPEWPEWPSIDWPHLSSSASHLSSAVSSAVSSLRMDLRLPLHPESTLSVLGVTLAMVVTALGSCLCCSSAIKPALKSAMSFWPCCKVDSKHAASTRGDRLRGMAGGADEEEATTGRGPSRGPMHGYGGDDDEAYPPEPEWASDYLTQLQHESASLQRTSAKQAAAKAAKQGKATRRQPPRFSSAAALSETADAGLAASALLPRPSLLPAPSPLAEIAEEPRTGSRMRRSVQPSRTLERPSTCGGGDSHGGSSNGIHGSLGEGAGAPPKAQQQQQQQQQHTAGLPPLSWSPAPERFTPLVSRGLLLIVERCVRVIDGIRNGKSQSLHTQCTAALHASPTVYGCINDLCCTHSPPTLHPKALAEPLRYGAPACLYRWAALSTGESDPLNELGTTHSLPRGVPYSLIVRLRAAAEKVAVDVAAMRSCVAVPSSTSTTNLSRMSHHSSSAASPGGRQLHGRQHGPPMEGMDEVKLNSRLDAPVEGSVRTPLALCCHEGLVEVSAHMLHTRVHSCPPAIAHCNRYSAQGSSL